MQTCRWPRVAKLTFPPVSSTVRRQDSVESSNLEVKEFVIDDGTMRDRFVICRNPGEAARDALVRGQLIAQLEAASAGSDERPAAERDAIACRLRAKPGLARFLRVTPKGLRRIDRAALTAEAHLDGKSFLLRTSDPTLSAEDVALAYKQLLEVERAWRDMKTTLDLHRRLSRVPWDLRWGPPSEA